ncbi:MULTISPECIES: NADP-dependent oxidoreductase [unclassified Luteococcus]|uniref:NADP-dependent oxidoreductase n=1 Tax=unclassified Luteococcus TaxID=2639923 RepID=UPI00313B2E7B
MHAYGITKYKTSRVDSLELSDAQLGPEDVLVEVRSASVNPLDLMIARGELKALLPYRLPLALGHDVAGVVIAKGAGATRFDVGDEVFGRVRDGRIGTFAERIAVHQEDLAVVPSGVDLMDAGALPLVSLTAWQVLVDVANVQPGQKVLVHGGAGGLGSVVVQLAAHLGADVTATCSGRDEQAVRSHGARTVIDYRTSDFAETVSGQDVVVDTVGGETLQKSMGVLVPGGIVVSVVGPPTAATARQFRKPWLAPVLALVSRPVRSQARKLGVRYAFHFMHADGARLAELAALYRDGVLRPVVGHRYSFGQTSEAVALVADKKARGKVVIQRTPVG